jgi:catechol 2,3-dioxygenase-like lactoylglutathione lyase family enzyme
MALARYKDLCIDGNDALRMGRFWGAVLGLEVHERDDGVVRLSGPAPEHTVWINPVPERRTVKQRVHLDVNATALDDVLEAGATVLDDTSFPWVVVADPEGGELCVFTRKPPVTQRLYEIGIDTGDSAESAAAIGTWWASLLGANVVHDERGFSYVEQIPGAPFDSLDFAPVPEPKTVKNRIHLDLLTDDVSALVAAGATMLRPRDEEIQWSVLADPDGNEFCAFVD